MSTMKCPYCGGRYDYREGITPTMLNSEEFLQAIAKRL